MSKHMHVGVALVLISLVLLAGCGGGAKTQPAPTPVVSVSVTPATPTISVLQTVQLQATVSGSTNAAVTWSVTPNVGTVVNGLFTPPLKAGTYTVKATSQADTTKSATATVTVTAPAPQFSGTPSTVASETSGYSYTLEATDPAGTEVTFTLTTAPEGATLEGDTITWMPTAAQARRPNTFVAKATSAAGGTAPLTWTVTPVGVIRGSWIDKYWTADGKSIDVPNDLTGAQIGALIVTEDGRFMAFSGTGYEDGTFEIPDVPAGKYWLEWNGMTGIELYLTDSSTFDYGSDIIGRPYDPEQSIETTLSFNLVGLNPIDQSWPLRFVSPNAGVYYETNYWTYWDMPIFNSLEGPMTMRTIDPEQGDTAYVLQWDRVNRNSGMADKTKVHAVTSGLAFDSVATVPDGVTLIGGQMSSSPRVFDFNLKGSEWAKLFATAGPGLAQIDKFRASLSIMPFVTDKFAYSQSSDFSRMDRMNNVSALSSWRDEVYRPGVELASMTYNDALVDQDLGAFRYVNPMPESWKPVFSAQQFATIPVYSDATQSYWYFDAGASFMTSDVPTGPIAPLMSNIKNPKINGQDFFAPVQINTSESSVFTLSWEPPTGLTPFGYDVSILDVGNGFIPVDFFTSETSITLPNFLRPGQWAFKIRAMADSRAKVETGPWRSGLPMADSSVISGPVTILADSPQPQMTLKMNGSTLSNSEAMTAPTKSTLQLKSHTMQRSFMKLQDYESVTKD